MELQFKPVTDENRKEILALELREDQGGFIETIEECLYEADHRSCWRPVGIYDGDILIGFAMYGLFWEYLPFGRLWLDRFLIDRRYQNMGYGKAALMDLLKRLWKKYHRKHIYLSVTDDNLRASALYQQFGFEYTGERDIHNERVMVLKLA